MSNFSPKARKVFLIAGTVMLLSEIWKQLCLTFRLYGGVYQWPFFPFQLCSMPMYVSILLYVCWNGKLRNTLLCFLKDYAMLAGIMSFFDTSGFREYGYLPLVIHSYTWHVCMILLAGYAGLMLARETRSVSSLHVWGRATAVYAVCASAAEGLNLAVYPIGPINMFYISPHYTMSQIGFRSLVPVIGNNAVILLYVALTVAGALMVHFLWMPVERRFCGPAE